MITVVADGCPDGGGAAPGLKSEVQRRGKALPQRRPGGERRDSRAPAPGPRLAMAFTVIESAEERWRTVHAPHLVTLIRAGTVLGNGVLAGRPGQAAA
jgi:hypothetical protein